VKYYRHYLEDRHFTVRTDSRALTWLDKFKDAKAKLTRWALALQEYSFTLEHVPGKENELPDFLSRNPSEDEPYQAEPDNERLVPPTTLGVIPNDGSPMIGNIDAGEIYNKIARVQGQVSYIRRTKITIGLIRIQGPQTRSQQRLVDRFTVFEDLLWRRGPNGDRLVVPRKLVPQLLYAYHDHFAKAHPGIDETFEQLARRYYWGYMRKKVAEYVGNCVVCSACKKQQRQKAAPMLARSPEFPFQMISVDMLGPYPDALRTKKRYILFATDVFSKWVEAKPYDEVTTRDVVGFLRDEVIARYGTPQILVSDNAKIFTGRRMNEFCERNRIEQRFSSIYHQRANPVERRVQELKKVLKVLLYEKRDIHWEQELPRTLQVLRSRINRATGETPASIVLGYELPCPGEWTQKWATARRVFNPQERRERNRRVFARQLQFQEKYHDPREPPVAFQVGDRVNARQRKTDAFAPSWTGPHEIVAKTGHTTYEVLVDGCQWNVHVDDLRPAKLGNRIDFAEDGAEDSSDSDSDSEGSEFEFPRDNDRQALAEPGEEPVQVTIEAGEVPTREARTSEPEEEVAAVAVAWQPSRSGSTGTPKDKKKSSRPCRPDKRKVGRTKCPTRTRKKSIDREERSIGKRTRSTGRRRRPVATRGGKDVNSDSFIPSLDLGL
jgi:transposase InsO family protein